jgi:hypothetical protein
MTRRRFPRSLSSRPALSAWLWCCLQIIAPERALAQGAEANAADVAAARTFAVEGVKLAQAGKCDEAVEKLERAEKLHHAPIVLSALGECKVVQGKFVEGTEMLRKVLREPLPDHPSPAHVKAYEHAQATLDAAAPKIGRLTISVAAQGEAQPTVTVDGEPVAAALLGAERPTDPGEHVVEASAVGYLKSSAKVTLSEGDKKSVKLELERDPSAATAAAKQDVAAAAESAPAGAVAAADRPNTEAREPASSSTHSGPNRTAAYVSWIAGGAALAVGAGFGIAAMSGKSDLDKQCNGNVCPADTQDKLDTAKRNGTIATIGFGVGAAGLALGTVLFFTAGGSSSESQTVTAGRPPSRHASGPKLSASLGLGNVRLSGEF